MSCSLALSPGSDANALSIKSFATEFPSTPAKSSTLKSLRLTPFVLLKRASAPLTPPAPDNSANKIPPVIWPGTPATCPPTSPPNSPPTPAAPAPISIAVRARPVAGIPIKLSGSVIASIAAPPYFCVCVVGRKSTSTPMRRWMLGVVNSSNSG